MHKRPGALQRLPARYERLFDRLVEVTGDDGRVRAVWLGGSFARGDVDAASDLDFVLAVADDAFEPITGDWEAWIAGITPTAYAHAHTFAPGMYYAATDDLARFDLTIEKVSDVPDTFFRERLVVFDRDGLDDQIPEPFPKPGPSAERVDQLVREFFRVSSMPETILVRDDWLLAVEHLHALRDLTRQLYLEANAPVPTTGIKHWKCKFTHSQQAALGGVPTEATDRDQLARAHAAASAAFLSTARPLAVILEVPWPSSLEAAAAQHVAEVLGLADPYPR